MSAFEIRMCVTQQVNAKDADEAMNEGLDRLAEVDEHTAEVRVRDTDTGAQYIADMRTQKLVPVDG